MRKVNCVCYKCEKDFVFHKPKHYCSKECSGAAYAERVAAKDAGYKPELCEYPEKPSLRYAAYAHKVKEDMREKYGQVDGKYKICLYGCPCGAYHIVRLYYSYVAESEYISF